MAKPCGRDDGDEVKVCPKTGKVIGGRRPSRSKWWQKLLFPVIGLASLIWFLVRVIPKPDRAEYPCQKIAMPIASAFVAWLTGLIVSALAFHRAKAFLNKRCYAVAILCLAMGVFAVYVPMGVFSKLTKAATATWYYPRDINGDLQALNAPIGVGRGVYPGRVAWAYDVDATDWDGIESNWWDDIHTDPVVIEQMLSDAVCDLAGEPNELLAWDALFRSFNIRRGKGDVGYQAGEKIAIKVNANNCKTDHTYPNADNKAMPAPQISIALIRQLVNEAGVDDGDIVLYDAIRLVVALYYDPIVAEFPDVGFVDWTGGDGRIASQWDHSTRLWWSDPLTSPNENETKDIGGPQPVYLPQCVTGADYIINFANLKGHGTAGVTFCAKNHWGTILSGPETPRIFGSNTNNPNSGSTPAWAGVHPYIQSHLESVSPPMRPMGSYNPLVDMMGHPDVGEKTVLFIVDMLYTTSKQGWSFGDQYPWSYYPFTGDWASSILLSQDGVAIDSVSLDFMRNENCLQTISTVINDGDTPDNYMHEAALADDPPSGTFYDPDGDGVKLPSLGVHEHWNNELQKQYTGNLKTGNGIELVQSPMIKGDVTGAGVGLEDLAVLLDRWLDTGCSLGTNGWCDGADINHDTRVGYEDFAILSADWGKNVSPSP